MSKKFKHLSILLRQSRIDCVFTQESIAEQFGFGAQLVSNWERGICAPPGDVFYNLIKLLKINKEELVNVMVDDARDRIQQKVELLMKVRKRA
jgi:transcriptional regulator with XRE-family HTH domain